MATSSIDQFNVCMTRLKESGYEDVACFEQLGVHPRDESAQASLAALLKGIYSQQFKPTYNPETQLVYYKDDTGSIRGVFKPGASRARCESLTREMFFMMKHADHAAPTLISMFDFSQLPRIKALDLNPDAFLDEESDESEGEGAESEEVDFLPVAAAADRLRWAVLEDLPFAQDETLYGTKIQFVPATAKQAEAVKETDLLQLEGKLFGSLQAWVSEEQAPLQDYKTVLLAALVGARDLKKDALVRGVFVDSEEVMAAESPESKAGALHLPILSELDLTTRAFSEEEMRELIDWALAIDVEDICAQVERKEFPFRLEALDSLEAQEEVSIRHFEDLKLHCFAEESGREQQYFPRLGAGEQVGRFFRPAQVETLRSRLERLQRAFSSLQYRARLPESNLWGLIHIIDPKYAKAWEKLCKARERTLSGAASDLPATTERITHLGSKNVGDFLEASASSLGRGLLLARRERAASLPASPVEELPRMAPQRTLSATLEIKFYFNPS